MPDTNNLVTIIAAVLTVIGTIGGVVIANKLTANRSYKEKVWELRRVAYGRIVAEISAAELIYDDADVFIHEIGFPGYFEEKAYSGNNAEIAKHINKANEIFSTDYLILSDRFIELYNELAKNRGSDPYDTLSPDDEYDISSAAIRKFRPLLIERARQEIASSQNWWDRPS